MRERILKATVVICGSCVIYNEVLSLFRAIFFWTVLIFWLAAAVGLVWYFLYSDSTGGGIYSLRSRLQALTLTERIYAILLSGILTLSFWSAIVTFPHSFDSLVYHLPRQIRWIQQSSLEPFPTHIAYHIFRPPFSELLSMNLLSLTGRFHLLALVSWYFFFLAILLVSLIARDIGAGRKGQLLSALVASTLPIAFLQASTTKNDLIVATWVLAAIWFGFKMRESGRPDLSTCAYFGLCLGMGALTKEVYFLLAIPPVLIGAVSIFRREGKRFVTLIAIIIAAFLILNVGHFYRTWQVFGVPILPEAQDRTNHIAQVITPVTIISRTVRELGQHLATPSPPVNGYIEGLVEAIHEALGADINDPRTTTPARDFQITFSYRDEYTAPAPLHMLVLIILPVVAVALRRRLRCRLYWITLPIPYLILALIIVLTTWSSSLNPRLHLSVFFIVSALLGTLLVVLRTNSVHVLAVIVLLLVLLPSVLRNPRSPQIRSFLAGETLFASAEEIMFATTAPEFLEPYKRAAGLTRSLNPSSVGFYTHGYHRFEYPMMYLILDDLTYPQIQAFGVQNPTKEFARLSDAQPEIVIAFGSLTSEVERLTGKQYQARGRFGEIIVFEHVK